MTRVKLTKVFGDQEEFADLIGTTGKFRHDQKSATFLPDQGGDIVTMTWVEMYQDNSEIQVTTALGNRFVFKCVDEKTRSNRRKG